MTTTPGTTFTDTQGRAWTIDVTVTALRRVNALVGVDLAQAFTKPAVLGELIDNPVALADVLYALCQPQAKERGVSDEQFGEGLAGDVINAATWALLEGLRSFQRSPAAREAIGRLMTAMKRQEQAREQRVREALTDEAIETAMSKAMEASTSGN